MTIQKLRKGDKVAILSPSSGLAGIFPWVLDLGIERLKSNFQLVPVEYPTTRMPAASAKLRADDINAAFADPDIKGIIATLGGHDQIKVLKYIDKEILQNNPKPFFGYSDNTNLHQLLWKLGIPAYYGGSIMTQFAMQGAMHAITEESINNALFEHGEVKLPTANVFTDVDLDWADRSTLNGERSMEKNEGWYWDGNGEVEGVLWGGCVETLTVQLESNIYLPDEEDLKDIVLYLETAEDIPEHWVVEYLLIALGERGILSKTKAVLVGRPKAWQLEKQLDADQKNQYRKDQRDIVVRTVREYNNDAIIVQNMDFGHTDPQIIVPSRNKARIDESTRSVYFKY